VSARPTTVASGLPTAVAEIGPPAPVGPPAPPVVPTTYDVIPVAQIKHTLADGTYYGGRHVEPGVLLGPQKTLVKAFDCVSPGAPPASVIGVCVSFRSCEAGDADSPEVLAEIVCAGPALHVQLVQDGRTLSFRVAETEHALARRKMSSFTLPDGASPALGAFQVRNVTAHVDL